MNRLHNTMRSHQSSGFTLVELLVTISVLAILLALAVPSFAKMIATNRLTTQTNEFTTALHLARSEAVRRGQAVSIRASAATGVASYSFEMGWTIFTDADRSGDPASTVTDSDGTVLRQAGQLSGKTTIKRVTRSGSAGSYTYANSTSATDRMYVVFNGRGANDAGAAAYFRICDSGNTSVGGRVLQVSSVGKISLDSTSAACP